MPRKFENGQQVEVYYNTRRMHEQFYGIVEGYEDGQYIVRYLAGNLSPRNDLLVRCKVSEIRQVGSIFYNTMLSRLLVKYNDHMKRYAAGRYYYHHTDNTLVWLAYAVKRMQDKAYTRKYPIFETVWRVSRVY